MFALFFSFHFLHQMHSALQRFVSPPEISSQGAFQPSFSETSDVLQCLSFLMLATRLSNTFSLLPFALPTAFLMVNWPYPPLHFHTGFHQACSAWIPLLHAGFSAAVCSGIHPGLPGHSILFVLGYSGFWSYWLVPLLGCLGVLLGPHIGCNQCPLPPFFSPWLCNFRLGNTMVFELTLDQVCQTYSFLSSARLLMVQPLHLILHIWIQSPMCVGVFSNGSNSQNVNVALRIYLIWWWSTHLRHRLRFTRVTSCSSLWLTTELPISQLFAHCTIN